MDRQTASSQRTTMLRPTDPFRIRTPRMMEVLKQKCTCVSYSENSCHIQLYVHTYYVDKTSVNDVKIKKCMNMAVMLVGLI